MRSAPTRYLGLRSRLALLLACTVLPALLVLLVSITQARQAALQKANSDLRQLASLGVSKQIRAIDGARTLLATLAQTGEVQTMGEPCNGLLRQIQQANPTFTGFAVADLAGAVRCGSTIPDPSVSVRTRDWFVATIQAGTFTVGEYRVGGISGKPLLTAAYPVREQDALSGVILTGIDLAWLGQLAADPTAPPDATLVVLDPKGVTLAGAPLETPIGQPDPLAAATVGAISGGNFAARDQAGVDRLYATAPIVVEGRTIAVVRVGMPQSSLLAGANQAALGQLLALTSLTALAMAVIYFGGGALIVRPILRLLRATEALTSGDRAVRSNVPHTNDEIGRLARAFDTLAETLVAREAALRTSDARFQALADNAQDVFYRFRPGVGLEYISPAVQTVLGMTPAELLSDPEIFLKAVDPDDWAAVRMITLQTGNLPTQANIRWHTPDRQTIWTEQRLSAVRDQAGTIVAVDAVARDITARVAAETELQQRTELLQAIFDYTPFVVIVFDAALNPVLVNRAWEQRTGVTASASAARLMQLTARPNELLDVVRAADGTWHDLRSTLRADGEPSTYAWAVVALSDGGRIAFGQDVGERKQAEEMRIQIERRLQESQRLESLGVLAGGIAHDFNNLLVAIMGNAGLALEDLSTSSSARVSITQIEVAARRAADLTRQMLAYAGKGRFDVQKVSVNALIEEMTHLLQASILKNVLIRYLLTEPLAAVEADATQIRQVIMNLVVNAAEAIGTRSGIITIATGRIWADAEYLREMRFATELPEGEYIWIEVSDTGHGMDVKTKERIFDPFFSTKFTGRGLGLAAVQGIVRGHHGGIRVYSEVGRGTTFKIMLPSVAGPPAALQTALTAAWLGEGTILLVDDEQEVRTIAVRMLERIGFSVITAEDGGAAVTQFRAHPDIRCVLLDLTMPHVGGEEAFRQIHQLRPEVPVIVMSGYHEQEIISRFAGKGLAGALQKPFGPTELRTVLARALTRTQNADV